MDNYDKIKLLEIAVVSQELVNLAQFFGSEVLIRRNRLRNIFYVILQDMTSQTRKNVIGELKDYIMIVVGLALYAFGFTAFILPEKVVSG